MRILALPLPRDISPFMGGYPPAFSINLRIFEALRSTVSASLSCTDIGSRAIYYIARDLMEGTEYKRKEAHTNVRVHLAICSRPDNATATAETWIVRLIEKDS